MPQHKPKIKVVVQKEMAQSLLNHSAEKYPRITKWEAQRAEQFMAQLKGGVLDTSDMDELVQMYERVFPGSNLT